MELLAIIALIGGLLFGFVMGFFIGGLTTAGVAREARAEHER